MAKNCLILSSLFSYNRQGYDLRTSLMGRGCRVRLVQYGSDSDRPNGVWSIAFTQPRGRFSKLAILLNLMRFLLSSFFASKDIVVCIGMPVLPLGALYKSIFRSRLIYYSTEYVQYRKGMAFIIRKFVDRIIDVEDTRRRRMYDDLELHQPFYVLNNYPQVLPVLPKGGKLRRYLADNFGIKDRKLLVYAGSYQVYSCLEKLIEASDKFPENVVLVLMVSWGLPERLRRKSSGRYCLVPGCSGVEFFDWIVDADCALLPYESQNDFNVINCSPQKLFDCYAVGVPYLASKRPIVCKALSYYPNAGLTCDFSNVDSILAKVAEAVALKSDEVSLRMRELHLKKFNYSCYAGELGKFVCE